MLSKQLNLTRLVKNTIISIIVRYQRPNPKLCTICWEVSEIGEKVHDASRTGKSCDKLNSVVPVVIQLRLEKRTERTEGWVISKMGKGGRGGREKGWVYGISASSVKNLEMHLPFEAATDGGRRWRDASCAERRGGGAAGAMRCRAAVADIDHIGLWPPVEPKKRRRTLCNQER